MSGMKEFFELAAKDEKIAKELKSSQLEALNHFLKGKGLDGEAAKVIEKATVEVAEAHGFKFDKKELSLDELQAVAGGSCSNYIAYAIEHCTGEYSTM